MSQKPVGLGCCSTDKKSKILQREKCNLEMKSQWEEIPHNYGRPTSLNHKLNHSKVVPLHVKGLTENMC